MNYSSTAALEAMMGGVPVVFLRTAIYATDLHKDPLESRGAINVSSFSELEMILDRLIEDPAFRSEIIQQEMRWRSF